MHNSIPTQFSARERLIVVAISACFVSAPAWANPTGLQIVNGSASFNQAGKLLTVTNSPGAIINWNTFSIGAGETTRFNQASAASSVLNRVMANDPSVLMGTLSSNGKVWLVNPAGIMVGQGARIDVAGFIASTLNVRNEDFLAGRLNFGATPSAGKVENFGQITTPSGGSVYLIGSAVTNSGIINAPNGDVILAAGQTVSLVDTGTPGVKVDITGAEGNVTNLGQIAAEAGHIGMAGVLVRNSGTLNASSLVKEGGRIFLKASQDATAGGSISAQSASAAGGRIEVSGSSVSIPADAVLDASGQTQGGTIFVGGGYQGKDASIANADTTTIDASASLKADAIKAGKGGLIVAWSDRATGAHGSFSARGGAEGGAGGLVETSSKASLDVAGIRVDARAADGSAGTWLLDPADIIIAHGSYTGSPTYSPAGATSTIMDGDINSSLSSASVSITTSSGSGGSGNITVNGTADVGGGAYIVASGTTGARSLSLTADGNINVKAGASIYGSSSSPLTLYLRSGGNISHAGSIYSYGNVNLLAKGSIDFGSTTTSNLSTYGGAATLVANWNGVTSAPEVSATAQCSGSTYCGIGGSGTIATYGFTSGSSAGALTAKAAGNADFSGIQVYSSGSTGAFGTVGTAISPNGGAGSAGGAGGNISLNAAGVITLAKYIDVSGGTGGQGGTGYNATTAATTYSGTGGNGGAGGNSGTITVNGGSLNLAGTTMYARGGRGGTGGAGTTAGAAGTAGNSSAINLTATGDVTLAFASNGVSFISNYFAGYPLNILAGKAITFVSPATSTTGTPSYTAGLLNSIDASTTLIANWNGSTTAPDVAALGQCAGGSSCGIGGKGSFSWYINSLDTPSSGVTTFKAAGDIDLSGVTISANGYSGASKAGRSVSIVSTNGNLTTGSISANGGSGSSGTPGTSASPNGGAGFAGGDGGSISLSAAGTLTLASSINVQGGSGGTGGSGYAGTSTTAYTGSGGNGGTGGKAGSISVNGGSIVLSNAYLTATGGIGGAGGAGTSVGSIGSSGTNSSINVATNGDISVIGNNSIYADQFNLLAGKSIAFGTSGASSTATSSSIFASSISVSGGYGGSGGGGGGGGGA